MADETNEPQVETEVEEVIEPATETTNWEARAKQLEEKAIIQRERTRQMKLEIEKLKKSGTPKSEDTKPADTALLQKSFLRAAGITHAEDVELALKTAKKWGVEVDQLVDDDDFKLKLDKQRTARDNAAAASHVKGDGGSSTSKGADFFIARGAPPTRDEVPDRGERAKIARAMMGATKNTKKFYND